MALQSFYGNTTSSLKNDFNNALAKTKSNVASIVNGGSTAFTGMWSGGFAGINEEGIIELKHAINTYISNIESIINGFNSNILLDDAFHGQIRESASEFIISVKNLLGAYVSSMSQNLSDLDLSYQKYMESIESLSQNVFSDTSDIAAETKLLRQNTDNIKL